MALFEEVFRIEDEQTVRCVHGGGEERESVSIELLAKIFREIDTLRRNASKSLSEEHKASLPRMLSSLDSFLIEGTTIMLQVRVDRSLTKDIKGQGVGGEVEFIGEDIGKIHFFPLTLGLPKRGFSILHFPLTILSFDF